MDLLTYYQCFGIVVGCHEEHPACENKSSVVAEIGDRLATIDVGR